MRYPLGCNNQNAISICCNNENHCFQQSKIKFKSHEMICNLTLILFVVTMITFVYQQSMIKIIAYFRWWYRHYFLFLLEHRFFICRANRRKNAVVMWRTLLLIKLDGGAGSAAWFRLLAWIIYATHPGSLRWERRRVHENRRRAIVFPNPRIMCERHAQTMTQNANRRVHLMCSADCTKRQMRFASLPVPPPEDVVVEKKSIAYKTRLQKHWPENW